MFHLLCCWGLASLPFKMISARYEIDQPITIIDLIRGRINMRMTQRSAIEAFSTPTKLLNCVLILLSIVLNQLDGIFSLIEEKMIAQLLLRLYLFEWSVLPPLPWLVVSLFNWVQRGSRLIAFCILSGNARLRGRCDKELVVVWCLGYCYDASLISVLMEWLICLLIHMALKRFKHLSSLYWWNI